MPRDNLSWGGCQEEGVAQKGSCPQEGCPEGGCLEAGSWPEGVDQYCGLSRRGLFRGGFPRARGVVQNRYPECLLRLLYILVGSFHLTFKSQNEHFLFCTKRAHLGSLSIWIALLCKSDGAAQEKCVPRWQKKQKEDQWVEWQHHLLCNVDHLSFRLELVSSLSFDIVTNQLFLGLYYYCLKSKH